MVLAMAFLAILRKRQKIPISISLFFFPYIVWGRVVGINWGSRRWQHATENKVFIPVGVKAGAAG